MTPNDILLHTYISVLLSHYQKSVLLQQMGTNTETTPGITQRMADLETLIFDRHCHQIPPPQGSMKEEQGECKTRGVEDTRTTKPLDQQGWFTYELRDGGSTHTVHTGLHQFLCRHVTASTLSFPECRNEWIPVSYAFSWALFLLFVLYNSNGLVFVLLYFTIIS